MKLLMTGGTGFLGSELVSILAESFEKIYIICRRPTSRLIDEYKKYPSVALIKGDISSPDIIEDPIILSQVKNEIDIIFHGAAFYDIEGSYSSCFMYNVVGTQNVLYMAAQCKNLKHIHYVSTIAVAGDFKGDFPENELRKGQSFSSHYAKTKFDSEQLVRDFNYSGSTQIYRLGILVGNSKSGVMPKVDGPYYFLKILSKFKDQNKNINRLRYLPIPFNENARMPFIPVDQAALYLKDGIVNPENEDIHCYHVVAKDPPYIKNFIEDSLRAFGLNLKVIALPKTRVFDMIMPRVGIPKELLLYIYSKTHYNTKEFDRKFSHIDLISYSDYSASFYNYASRMFN